jgi:hypothetical protein
MGLQYRGTNDVRDWDPNSVAKWAVRSVVHGDSLRGAEEIGRRGGRDAPREKGVEGGEGNKRESERKRERDDDGVQDVHRRYFYNTESSGCSSWSVFTMHKWKWTKSPPDFRNDSGMQG